MINQFFTVEDNIVESEIIEKKSRFIAKVVRVNSEEEANKKLAEIKKEHRDARHNVFAYSVDKGRLCRFSDDGEPQGTSGMPTLEVLKKEEVFDVMCVITRYFGGTLLGAGGLVRAYSHTCKLALDAAGQAMMMPFAQVLVDCPYNLLEQVRRLLPNFEAEEVEADFGASVTLTVALPTEQLEAFNAKLVDATNGRLSAEFVGEELHAKKL